MRKLQTLTIMSETKNDHWYILPDNTVVSNQKEACELLGIGKNAFRNRVKSGVIKRITDKPKGYENGTNNNQ